MEVGHGGVQSCGEDREEFLEVGEERRVIEGPLAGSVGVPAGEGERMGEGEPVAVDLEIGAVVGGDEKDFHGGSHEGRPPHTSGVGWGFRHWVSLLAALLTWPFHISRRSRFYAYHINMGYYLSLKL